MLNGARGGRPRRASASALRLHLDRDERAVLEARFPDRHAAAPQLPAGADVRRECANPVQALLRPREVELAVGRFDLGRVRRLAHLRRERRLRQHLVQQLDRELGRARIDRPRVVLRRQREAALRGDRACIELLHRLVDRDADLLVAGEQRPLDRGRAAPARQQRRMDVQPEPLLEQALRDQQAVRGDDRRLTRKLQLRRRPVGLQHRDPELFGDELRRRRRELPAAPGRAVGTRQQRRDVVSRSQPLEHVRAERRRGGDGDPHGRTVTTAFGVASPARPCATRRPSARA